MWLYKYGKCTFMKTTILPLAITACFALVAGFSQAATISLTNSTGGLGALLDEFPVDNVGNSLAVPEIPGLNIMVVAIASDGTGSGTLDLNSTAGSFGINSLGTTDDDASSFDAALNETVTFSFDQDVEITQIDFLSFGSTETFNFAGQVINEGDLASSVFTFSAPLEITAGTSFTLEATAGTIGIESIEVTVVPEPSSFALLGLAGLVTMLRRRR